MSATMECPQIDLYEFLTESELQQYYNAIKNELKITNAAQFKYAADEDLRFIGLSRPEIRRLRKFYEKHFPHSYLSKIKRLLQAPATIVKREDGGIGGGQSPSESNTAAATTTATRNGGASSPGSKVPNNKHIIPADAISVNKQLGIGEFGIVQQGVWTNGSERIQVAIKCLCRERMQSNPMEFLKEAAIMHSIEHENIVRLYGVVLATDSLMLVTELAHLRSLLECLKDSGLRVSFLTIPTLCEFALQICNGMRYLEQKRLIHRDLAARNILVFSKDKVKISDFGLSRALGVGKDYYKTNFNVNLKLPIAWCAPECINYLRFTNASDVWAYGVCLWEMFSYGFQPWAALTGLQILEAIDAPNYQRLEQPDCCPREYYTLMMKCWQDDAAKRPKFSEIYEQLPDMKPEQLKAVVNCVEPKKDHLLYRQGDIISVLDRNTGTPFWKGVLSTGKTGYFNPSNTVAFLEGLPSSNRDSFSRVGDHRISKRKLRTEMISKPQNDFKHTGHVGIDGATFGDIAFLGSSQNYNHVPKQIVTPYKPSEDIEQTPLLLPPTPTSPDSLQTASGYFPEGAGTSMNPTFIPSTEHTPKLIASNGQSSFDFAGSNPFASHKLDEEQLAYALQNNNYGVDGKSLHSTTGEPSHWRASSRNATDDLHEYHEISDDEITGDKLDFGPSLLDEINSMFGSISGASGSQPKSPDFDRVNTKNEFAELSAKYAHKAGDTNGNKHGLLSKKKTTTGTVKPISVKDEKILNHAIEIANEISARSMIDLASDHTPAAHSPKRKFSFRLPHLSSGGGDKSNNMVGGSARNSALTPTHGSASPFSKKKNFTEELQSIPDIQSLIGEEGREAYNSLIERKGMLDIGPSPAATLLRHMDTDEFELMNAKTLPRRLGSQLSHPANAALEPLAAINNVPDSTRSTSQPPPARPMTLPTRGAAQRVRRAEQANVEQRHGADENRNSMGGNDSCESPSYMTLGTYKFPEPQEANPLPLPSREGKKQVKTSTKRHVRKYPLIIPANGVQRTLNKLADFDEDSSSRNSIGAAATTRDQQQPARSIEVVAAVRTNSVRRRSDVREYENMPAMAGEASTHTYQNLDKLTPADAAGLTDSASLQFESILESDLSKDGVLQSPDVTDGFLNFSIQKEHYNKSKEVVFEPTQISGLYVNDDELRNLDKPLASSSSSTTLDSVAVPQEMAPTAATAVAAAAVAAEAAAMPQDAPQESGSLRRFGCADNELAGNALFKKVRASVNQAMNHTAINGNDTKATTSNATTSAPQKQQTEAEYFAATAARLADSNSVSCEDLLEFSDKKPRGCERGVDSDEVRIMVKVLGKDSTPTRCLGALEFINWDVHKSIKLIKLQNILAESDLSLAAAYEALQQQEWDLHTTAVKLKGVKL
ncbi:activated Cdc42 kinase-like isoform X2 [Drosophila sulfurigaster albostrigata]|uniref:activated Cdc42 kinase-like isoform X2 n=1 Tax=Drosophila sulfurigaster albostrigata TaxID=89887 RepID=UPI002D21901B|nr:activated Cdc42 kinase-like isoform X2 [Drosophila sulfurigaster albostrigata]